MKTIVFKDNNNQTITAFVNSQDLVFIEICPDGIPDLHEHQYITLNRQDLEEFIQYLDSLQKNFIISEEYPDGRLD